MIMKEPQSMMLSLTCGVRSHTCFRGATNQVESSYAYDVITAGITPG